MKSNEPRGSAGYGAETSPQVNSLEQGIIYIQVLGNKSQTMLRRDYSMSTIILVPSLDLKGVFSSSTKIIVLPMEGHTDTDTSVLTHPVLTI
ncbi:hypothetical protein F511_21382 [Dorcoceras hygrometricum]|uniref:Uncharacterized protein n=1 Tax=Dorcoceras hygrometricum TaxID=472368 RepID=A0A2Z7D8J4_9LAMI|nr:hypothetical protein F511_21382 [Dorcoceras hygrometricum]